MADNRAAMHLRTAGYLVGAAKLSEDLLNEVRNCVPNETPSFEGELDRMDERMQMADWLQRTGIPDELRSLTGAPNVLLHRNRHNHLRVDRGSGSRAMRPHRDALQSISSYVTVCIAIDGFEHPTAHPVILPASHLWPVGFRSNGGGYWLDESEDAWASRQLVRVPLVAGSVFYVDPFTYHAAGTGSETAPRVMLTLALGVASELRPAVDDSELVISGVHVYRGREEVRLGENRRCE